MGYLHDKGIVHKELKSKNIHIERVSTDYTGKDSRPPKAYVADFGLFDLYRFSQPSPEYRTAPTRFVAFARRLHRSHSSVRI